MHLFYYFVAFGFGSFYPNKLRQPKERLEFDGYFIGVYTVLGTAKII
jgi:hypothetical protein